MSIIVSPPQTFNYNESVKNLDEKIEGKIENNNYDEKLSIYGCYNYMLILYPIYILICSLMPYLLSKYG